MQLDQPLGRALDYAAEIAGCVYRCIYGCVYGCVYECVYGLSPDSVVISRLAAREAWEAGVSRATIRGQELWAENRFKSRNTQRPWPHIRRSGSPSGFLPTFEARCVITSFCGLFCSISLFIQD